MSWSCVCLHLAELSKFLGTLLVGTAASGHCRASWEVVMNGCDQYFHSTVADAGAAGNYAVNTVFCRTVNIGAAAIEYPIRN